MTAPNLNASQAIALLKELASMAEDATLSGAFSDGLSSARDRINWLMAWAEAQEISPAGFFRPLSDKASWGDIGVEARMLMASLKEAQARFDGSNDQDDEENPADSDFYGETFGAKSIFGPRGPFGPHGPFGKEGIFADRNRQGEKQASHSGAGVEGRLQDPGILVAMAPFLDAEDLASMVTAHMESGGEFDEGLLVALAPFLGSQILGRLVKARMMKGRAPTPPEPPAPPAEPEPVVPEADYNHQQAYHQLHEGLAPIQPLRAGSHDPGGVLPDQPAVGEALPPSLPDGRNPWS